VVILYFKATMMGGQWFFYFGRTGQIIGSNERNDSRQVECVCNPAFHAARPGRGRSAARHGALRGIRAAQTAAGRSGIHSQINSSSAGFNCCRLGGQ
jgi:hypothetical protein